MPRRRATRRFAAWLGILAISLAMFMPLGSQLVAQADQASDALCSAAGHDIDHAAVPDAKPDTARQRAPGAHLDACGYCSLLAHLPGLTSAAPPAPGAMQVTYRAYAPRHACAGAREPRHLRRLSHAPPVSA